MDRATTHSPNPPDTSPDGGVAALDTVPDERALPADAANSEVVRERSLLSHVGRYVLRAPLGDGGVGSVYEAWDPLLSREVAIKTLQFGLKMSERLALDRLLLQEARAAAQLSHRYIVTVHDAGLSAHGVYLAMERLKGRDLRQALATGWMPSVPAALKLVRRVADALAFAHARGMVHGDLKPANVFLLPNGRPKVLDFGIARATQGRGPGEAGGQLLGSPQYMAPEQLRGEVPTARTDLYALGLVLYELLVGRKAFPGQGLESLRVAIADGRCEPLAVARPDLPPALLELVERLMAVDPALRPSSAQSVSGALRRLGDTDAIRAFGDDQPASPDARRRRWSWRWALSGGTIGLLSLGLLTGTRQGDAPQPPTRAQPSPPEGLSAPGTPARPSDRLREADTRRREPGPVADA